MEVDVGCEGCEARDIYCSGESKREEDVIGEEALALVMEKRRADQLDVNCRWMLVHLDAIHEALCPNEFGTWQERVLQSVAASKRIAAERAAGSQ